MSIFWGLHIVFAVTAYAAETTINYLDELRFEELQLSAITTDMYLYLGWGIEEKEAMKEAAGKAIADLNGLKSRLMAQDFPDDLSPLKNLTLKMTEQLTTIYQSIEEKSEVEIKKEFVPFNDLYAEYASRFKQIWNKSFGSIEAEQSVNSLEEELRWFGSEQMRRQYQEASGYLKAKSYTAAYKILKEMAALNEGETVSDLIKLRLSDALLTMDHEGADNDGLNASEQGLKLLVEIVESNSYSPILYEAFYKWRTIEQQYNHGMSNMSAIPNKEYNVKRWQMIQTVKKYLLKNPTDKWAQTQIDLLWDLPNIQRGGPYGNDNLIHWGILYTDLESKKNGAA